MRVLHVGSRANGVYVQTGSFSYTHCTVALVFANIQPFAFLLLILSVVSRISGPMFPVVSLVCAIVIQIVSGLVNEESISARLRAISWK